MASCECCYSEAARRACGTDHLDEYNRVMHEHQERRCVCTADTPDGAKARAGQFWRDGRDVREDEADDK